MQSLLVKIEQLKESDVKPIIDARMTEFKKLGKTSSNEIFIELCFCIMTANFNAERTMNIQDKIKNGVCHLSETELMSELKVMGHRFPSARAKYISDARRHKDSLKGTMKSFVREDELREWLVTNIKGLGYKEASHFMRNVGYENVAIIDFHIIDVLVKHGLIERPKTLTPKKYLEIEMLLKEIADKANLTLAELDLYLWYMETGKVLK